MFPTRSLSIFSVLLFVFDSAFSAPVIPGLLFSNCKFLDLTHVLAPGVPHWGSNDLEFQILVRGPFKVNEEVTLEYLEANKITLPEHFGTHMDAPAHFFKRPEQRVDNVPLQSGIGPACVFDISEKVKNSGNRDYGLTIEDITQWEAKNGEMPSGCIALVYSGWEFKWSDPADFLGTLNGTNISGMHFPGISPEAGEYLAVKKRVKAVGTDTLSMDPGNAIATDQGPLPVHYSILGRNLLGFENVNNLHKLPPRGATVAMLPLKIKDASGIPIRGFAVGWDGPDDPCRQLPAPKAHTL